MKVPQSRKARTFRKAFIDEYVELCKKYGGYLEIDFGNYDGEAMVVPYIYLEYSSMTPNIEKAIRKELLG